MQAIPLDLQTVAALFGIAVPLLTAFLVKHNAPSALKIFVNLLLAIGAGEITILIQYQGHHITVWLFVNTALATLVTSLAAYRGIWRPINTKAYLAPNFGLGPKNTQPPAAG